MSTKLRPAAALLAALAVSAAVLPGCTYNYQQATVPASMTTAMPAATTVGVDVETHNGKVVITQDPTAGGATVTAEAKLMSEDRAQRFTVDATLTVDGVLVVRPVWPDGERHNNEKCSFEITAPDLREITARTSNGSVRLDGGDGKAYVQTSNGSITITQREGETVARTSNGRIEVTDGAGALDLVSSNGSIAIRNTSPGPADAPYHWRASTSNGSIKLDLVEPIAGRVRASTSNGRATVTRRTASGESRRLISARSVDHDLGGGEGEIVLTTSNGAIVVVTP